MLAVPPPNISSVSACKLVGSLALFPCPSEAMTEQEQIELELAARRFAKVEFCAWMMKTYWLVGLREAARLMLPKDAK